MLFNRFSSRFAIFFASSGRPALCSFLASRSASSSSSSSSPPSPRPPSGPEPSNCIFAWIFFRSFCTSEICRDRTALFTSCSRDFWMFELISLDTRLVSDSLWSRSKTYSSRCRTSTISKICWRSSTVSWVRLVPTTPASRAGEEGQRHWRSFFPDWPLSCVSSTIFSRMLCTSARVVMSPSSAASSSMKRTLATRIGDVCANSCTVKRSWPSSWRRTLAVPAFGLPPLAVGETIRQ
mmetsp:Transcript_123519/g.349796  ORF Transcript_123519/g.349796 Transcript_123519/m.349796 type:complete len:237 (-) Transcript_123519:400-1110(-)